MCPARVIVLTLLFAATTLAQQSVRGIVHDVAGTPVPAANVKLISGNQLVAETSTAPDGIFHFDSPTPGTYDVEVVKTGLCISQRLSATLRPDAGANLNVILNTPESTNVPKRLPANARIRRPPPLRSPAPVYPPNAKAHGSGGTVTLAVLIDEYGAPLHIRASRDSSPQLAQVATEAVQQWRYRATALNCVPVQVETDIVFEFVSGAGTVVRRDGL